MKSTITIRCLLALAGALGSTRAAVVDNRLADTGFEAIAGNEPNTNSLPWFTSGEDQVASFVSSTKQVHSGNQSAKFAYYYDDGAIVQNTGVQIEAGKDYEVSMWMFLPSDERSTSAAHTNAPTVAMTLYTSSTGVAGAYAYRTGFFGNQPDAEDRWQQFTGVFKAADLSAWVGQHVQIRFAKKNANTTHKIYIDDTTFGEALPLHVASVSPDNEQHAVTKMAMGSGLVYCWYPDSMFADGEAAHIVKDIGVGALRWPGGAPTTFYHWNGLNGQGWMDNWNPAYNHANDNPPAEFMDLDEYLALINATGAEIMLGVNMSSGKEWNREADGIEEARALMQACKDRGHDVKYVFFDNENFQSGNNYNRDDDGDGEAWTVASYADSFNLHAAAVKSVYPNAKLIANYLNNVTGPAFQTDIATMFGIAGTNIDYVDIHWYWQWETASWAQWKSELPMRRSGSQSYKDAVGYANNLFATLGCPHIKMASLEWNIGPGPWETDPDHNHFKTALMQSEMQMQFLQGGLDIGMLWTLDVPHTLPTSDRFAMRRVNPNATALWMWLFSKTVGKTVVQSSSSAAGIYTVAAKGSQGELVVYLLNKTDIDCDIEFDIPGYATDDASEAWRFHDDGSGRGVLQKTNLQDVSGKKRTTLLANSLNVVGFNDPASTNLPNRPVIRATLAEPIGDGLLIGWDASTGAGGDIGVSGITGALFANNAFDVDSTAGSTDGTFGTAIPGASTALTAYAVRTESPGTMDTVGLEIINQSGAPLRLDAIHFDYSRCWSGSPQDVALVYACGDLDATNQTVVHSAAGLPITGKTGDYPDFDWPLANLPDRILNHGESAFFTLVASNATSIYSQGMFDNIAISGGTVSNAGSSAIISWRGQTGTSCTVMQSTNLVDGAWSPASETFVAKPGDLSVPVDPGTSAFYRVEISP